MSRYRANRIKKGEWFRVGPSKQAATRRVCVIGYDTEADTSIGRTMLLQFSLPDEDEDDVHLIEVDNSKHATLKAFIRFIDDYCTERGVEYLVYGWNMSYELTQLFQDLDENARGSQEFVIKNISGWQVKVLNFKREIVIFTKGDGHKRNIRVTLLDGMAFYRTSLDKAARMLGMGEKYEASGLDRRFFTRADLSDADFLRYSRRDAYITRRVGEYIQRQHFAFNIRTTISAPHFASTVFRTHFLSVPLTPPAPWLEDAGLASYHGGKNGDYLRGPEDVEHCWQYDITSAYPEAMRALPNIEEATWEPTTEITDHALYEVSGVYKRCMWRAFQNHDGTWPQSGRIDKLWVTGYELKAALEHNELAITRLRGYTFVGPEGGPLVAYVDRFFYQKRYSVGPERENAKLLLNSLYGKFFQKQAIGDVGSLDLDALEWRTTSPDEPYDYEAGGLYNPPIASLITGFVRGKIHRLEHKYDAMMTSTDGMFARNPPDPADLGDDLGKLTVEHGRLRIWRERLYIFDGDDGKRKFALHGFRGKVSDLEAIPLQRGTYTYHQTQLITLKMSVKSYRGKSYTAGAFVELPFQLTI